MPACSQCSVEVPETQVWFLTGGAPACKACYLAGLSREAEERAREASSDHGVPGLRPDSPAKMMLKGGAIFGLGVALLIAGVVFADRFYIYPLFVLAPGFVMFARGLHLRRGR